MGKEVRKGVVLSVFVVDNATPEPLFLNVCSRLPQCMDVSIIRLR